jgi:hypothetical protein
MMIYSQVYRDFLLRVKDRFDQQLADAEDDQEAEEPPLQHVGNDDHQEQQHEELQPPTRQYVPDDDDLQEEQRQQQHVQYEAFLETVTMLATGERTRQQMMEEVPTMFQPEHQHLLYEFYYLMKVD